MSHMFETEPVLLCGREFIFSESGDGSLTHQSAK